MGELVAHGKIPYKDFFFAHPPLQIYLYGAVFKIFGFNLGILKFMSAAAAVIAAFFVQRVLREKSEMAAIIGVLLFFFSHSVLLFTSFPTGTEYVMMFSAAGFYYFLKRRSVMSGVLLGLGAVTGFLALIPAAILGGWMFIRNLNDFRKFMTGFLAVFVLVNGIFVLLTKGTYITQTLTYNLLKPEGVLDTGRVITRVIGRNWFVLIAAATAIFAKGKLKSPVLIPAIIVGVYAVAFTVMNTVFDYYFMTMLPYLAILAGFGIVGLLGTRKFNKKIVYGAVLTAVVLVSAVNYNNFAGNDAYDFEDAREVANYIRDNSAEDEKIFGDDQTTPLISLLSEREIAFDFIDSNDLRFRTGLEDADLFVERLREEGVRYFLVRRLNLGEGVKLTYGVTTLPEFDAYLKEKCEVTKTFKTPWRNLVKEYEIYECD